MYKVFTLAVAVTVSPLVQKTTSVYSAVSNSIESPVYFYPYKNTITTSPFEPEKKPAAAWSQNWMATAQDNIRKSEYHFKWEEKLKAYCTPNRKNNLRFFYNTDGFTVEPRTTQIPLGGHDPLLRPEEIKYKNLPNWKVKFSIDKKQLGKGNWQVNKNQAEYVTKKITVQYINDEEGMRQNFIVNEPLSKSNSLKINFNVKTRLRAVLKNNRIVFFHKKTEVLHYKDLKVWDASGKLLEASIKLGSNYRGQVPFSFKTLEDKKKNKRRKFYIEVETKDAVYPITIDPISTTPSSILESNQVGARLGFSVASAGDVNGDGYSDVVVGVYAYDDGETDEGAAFIYHGPTAGISTTPAAIVQSNQVAARLGLSVAGAGDVNGDGYSDIIVGAPFYDNGETDEGAVYIYHGSAAGIVNTPAVILESNQAGAQFGYSVACAGNVNGDGYSDVVAGAWLYDNPQVNEGAAFVYHGSAAGIVATVASLVESNQAAANFGISVAGAGDVNGDGYSDIIVGAEDYDNVQTDEGVAFIYHGSSAGINSTPVIFMESNQTLSQFGFSVSCAGDVNGDGYSDVLVGAYLYANGEANEGVAFVYHGSASGINNNVAALLECNQIAASFGTSVACAGDVNGDGYSDVIVGATQYDNGENNEGAAFVYLGSATGVNTAAIAVLESNQANAQMGRGVASAGDVNGDGYSDVIVGAPDFDNPDTNEGAAFVYHGAANGINAAASVSVESNQASSSFGFSVAGAGDLNADGYSDVIVGAYNFDNGESNEGVAFIYYGAASGINASAADTLESNQANAVFGNSVASAGDVNGDGYSDLIVGARLYDDGESNEGVAFIYHGSVSGINTTAADTLEINQANANFGTSVSGAGDVNGDGYSDVIIGAPAFNNGQPGEGAAFVYYGSATGINTSFADTLESNQIAAISGFAVAGAGDVNGDGFSDVIVGAPDYDNGETNEGRVFVYHGSESGIITAAVATMEPDLAGAHFGFAVAGAGDVNGDGYSDVIVGAVDYSNGQTGEGAAFVYHGSVAGLNTIAANILESNQGSAYLGSSVSSAGDTNGDGYSDIIVGAYFYDNGQIDEGAAFVYRGSVTGINIVAADTLESNQASANFGTSVSTAGDVNGDGYSDVIVGANNYDNGESNEGAAFVYHGNSPGTNKRNNLRLYNRNLTTPLNSSNFVFGNFGAGLYARSFLGRAKGKLVWETRLNYNAYSGTPITNSTFFTAQQGAYTDLGLAGVELKNIIDKLMASGRYTKLRARVKYDPATALTGQVYGPWRNVSSVIDGNSLGALPIELVSFKAAWLQKGKTAQLSFITDKENGICCFEIEKSPDGFTFTSIGTVAAKNTAQVQEYRFIDNNARNKNQYYRLKIKGINGKIEFSNIQQLQNDRATEILVFPNPTTDVLQLLLNNSYDKIHVQVINSSGQVVKKFVLSVSNGVITIPVQNLSTGPYWLHLQYGSEKQLLQFIKQ